MKRNKKKAAKKVKKEWWKKYYFFILSEWSIIFSLIFLFIFNIYGAYKTLQLMKFVT